MTILIIFLLTTGIVFSSVMLLREQKLKRQLLEERIRFKKEKDNGNTSNS
jgi:cell division protein FtsL